MYTEEKKDEYGYNRSDPDINSFRCSSCNAKITKLVLFFDQAPIVVFTGTMDADGVYAVLSSSSFHLMAIICMFSGMIAATGLDIVMGNALDKLTGNVSGKKKKC